MKSNNQIIKILIFGIYSFFASLSGNGSSTLHISFNTNRCSQKMSSEVSIKRAQHKKCNLKKIGITGQTQTKQRRLCEDNAERIVKIKKNTICEHDYDDTIGDDDGCSPALEAGKAGSLGWPVTAPSSQDLRMHCVSFQKLLLFSSKESIFPPKEYWVLGRRHFPVLM